MNDSFFILLFFIILLLYYYIIYIYMKQENISFEINFTLSGDVRKEERKTNFTK